VYTNNFNGSLVCCNPANQELQTINDGNDCTVDECDPATGEVTHVVPPSNDLCADGVGSRALAATPPCGTQGGCDDSTLVALQLSVQLTIPGEPIVDLGFIQPSGSIAQTPAFDTPSNWGTVTVARSGLIRPNTLYFITLVPDSEQDAATSNLNLAGSTSVMTDDFGDIDANGVCNFNDILLGVFAFQGRAEVEPVLADIEPCVPNNIINLADVFRAVLCFRGILFDDVCPVGVCCVFPTNPCGSCSDQFEFEWFQDDCENIGGVWSLEGECGPAGECPDPPCVP
jgi:hypothetical protein